MQRSPVCQTENWREEVDLLAECSRIGQSSRQSGLFCLKAFPSYCLCKIGSEDLSCLLLRVPCLSAGAEARSQDPVTLCALLKRGPQEALTLRESS